MKVIKCHYCGEALNESDCCGMYGDVCVHCAFAYSAEEHADDEESSIN